jgi:hypothetical protein
MSLRRFLIALQEHGRVQVGPIGDERSLVSEDGDEAGEAGEVLAEFDRHARLELPFAPPPLSREAALWGAAALYRGCQFLVHREVSAGAIRDVLSRPAPGPVSPAVAYSVDLSFRYLPDLISLARGIAGDDPLVVELLRLGREWPLSSVGLAGLEAVDVATFIDDRCLRGLYVDRIIERRDVSRLEDHRVRQAAREALGIHGSLCPEISAALAGEDVEDTNDREVPA